MPDIAVFRRSTGEWFILRSSDQQPGVMAWGSPGHGDVRSRGTTTATAGPTSPYRSTTGQWFIAASASGLRVERWGLPEFGDLPVPHDYDGDGRTDLAVYSRSSGK